MNSITDEEIVKILEDVIKRKAYFGFYKDLERKYGVYFDDTFESVNQYLHLSNLIDTLNTIKRNNNDKK